MPRADQEEEEEESIASDNWTHSNRFWPHKAHAYSEKGARGGEEKGSTLSNLSDGGDQITFLFTLCYDHQDDREYFTLVLRARVA